MGRYEPSRPRGGGAGAEYVLAASVAHVSLLNVVHTAPPDR